MRIYVFTSMLIFVVFILGCGENGLFDADTNLPDELPPKPAGLTALDFPTANGSLWTYSDTDTGVRHTLSIDGVRDINGTINRRLKNSTRDTTTDVFAANGWYIRLDGEYARAPLPIITTYFFQTTDAYIETAFDAFVEFLDNPTFHQKHFPTRQLWQFPMQLNTQWVVFRTSTTPQFTTIRRVVSDRESITVPAGTYKNAYLIEEFTYMGEADNPPPDEAPTARYWVVPNVGVVKYEYTDYTSSFEEIVRGYELIDVKVL